MLVAENQSMQVKYIYSTSLSGFASWPGDTSLFYSMGKPGKTFDIRRTNNIRTPEQMTTSTIIAEGKFPAVSPDNGLLAYVCNGTSEICIIEISSGITLATTPLNYIKIDNASMPATMMWSGDGQWLYYASADDGDWDIFRIRYDGSAKVNLTSDWSSNELMPAIQW
jgi:Tol biopolymer transport system component